MKDKLKSVIVNMKESYKAVFVIFLFVLFTQGVLFNFKEFGYVVHSYIIRLFTYTISVDAPSNPLLSISVYMPILVLFIFILYTRFFNKENKPNYNNGAISTQVIISRLIISFLILTFTVVLALTIIKTVFDFIGSDINPYIGFSLSATIKFYITAVYLFGIFSSIQNGAKLGQVIKSTTNFIFSRSSAILLGILLLINVVYQTINANVTTYFYLKAASLIENGGLLAFFDTISMRRIPLWYNLIVLAINALLIFFVYAYVSTEINEKKPL